MADRHEREARALLFLTPGSYLLPHQRREVHRLAAALAAAERRGAEAMRAAAAREVRALRDAYDAKAVEHNAHPRLGAYWKGMGQGADGCGHVVDALDIDAVLEEVGRGE